MSFLPFIESIFYLSLGIIVILIFLIVFHFKQRIESLEKKGFLLTEMYNNLVKEFSIMKTVVYSPPITQQKQNILFSTEPVSTPSYNKIIVMDKVIEEEEEEESDSDSEYESEDEDLDLDLEVVELEPETDLEEIINVLESEPEPETILEESLEPEKPNTISYNKMNLNELKMMVITKGLSTNPNKLKRAELLKLLEEEVI